MTRVEKAKEYFMNGYNCAQSVLLAFSDVLPVEETVLEKMSLPFGAGVGRMRNVCGAISGCAMTLGILYGESTGGKQNKDEVYAAVQEVSNAFKAKNGSIVCAELLHGIPTTNGPVSEERTPAYYKKRPCVELVVDAVEILENYIKNHSYGD